MGPTMKNTQNKINTDLLADNLLKAREASGRSIKEISSLVNIPASRLRNYEKGKYFPSLPELESISFIYRIPILALIGEWDINHFIHTPNKDQLLHLIEIRNEIISTKLSLAREEAEISYKDLSNQTGITTGKIRRYETGQSIPSLDDLIKLCESLNLDLSGLIDSDSPIGVWQDMQSTYRKVSQMPVDLIGFLKKEDNHKYLMLTKGFSDIGIDSLHELSDSLSTFLNNMSSMN